MMRSTQSILDGRIAIQSDYVKPLIYLAGQRFLDYMVFFKMRLSLLVLFTAVMSYLISLKSSIQSIHFIYFTIGTLFIICGANAFNQIMERYFDSLMDRTCTRPLPRSTMGLFEAITLAGFISIAGFFILALKTNYLTALLGCIAFFIYLLLYTPLKRVSAICTYIGAISGAIPAFMGNVAVTNKLHLLGFILFSILFFWQFPHFFSIGFIYREDYEKAGFKILPVTNITGEKVALHIVSSVTILILLNVLLISLNFMGNVFLFGSIVSVIVFLYFAINFSEEFTKKSAYKLMGMSFFYIFILFILMTVDRHL